MHRVLASLLLATALAAPAAAQTADPVAMPLPDLATQLAAGKPSVIARALALTPAEESDFWPVYDELQRGLGDVIAKRRAARAALAAGTDAADAVEDLVEADIEHAELLERAWSRLRGALPASKLARYLQLERRIAATDLL